MDYEKKYKKALVDIQELYNSMKYMSSTDALHTTTALERAFPELKKNDEEQIRKYLIDVVNDYCKGSEHDGCIAWLEKQGEQNPANKVEPKFHEGDWVVQGRNILKIRYVGDEYYCFDVVGGFVDDMLISELDSLYHLWTIQDAKDGDVLVGSKGSVILMFRGIGNTEWDDVIDYHCYYDCHRKDFIVQEGVEYWGNTENTQLKPSTKEQCNLLFQKMKEAGYMWDNGKKELKKIEPKPDIEMITPEESLGIDSETYNKIVDECIYGGNSPSWSEEDETTLSDALWCCKQAASIAKDENDMGNIWYAERWLKSLKERIKPQWKPSEEQLNALNTLNLHGDISYVGQQKQLIELYEQLKKL